MFHLNLTTHCHTEGRHLLGHFDESKQTLALRQLMVGSVYVYLHLLTSA